MLTQLPEHFQTDFADNWNHRVQQKESRLENRVMRDVIKGKEKTYSYLGKGKMRLITTRNGKTIPSDTPMAKRWLRPKGWDEVTYIDQFDEIALGDLPTPRSEHVELHARAAKRTMDEIIIEALQGTAYIGEDGTLPVDVPASQRVAVDYVYKGAAVNSGLTLAKLTRAKFILDANEVEKTGWYFIHSARQLQDLLADVIEVKSGDFNNVKALVDGNVNKFLGFEFVMTQLLTLDTVTDIRTCIAYQKDCICLGLGMGITPSIDIRPDLNHTVQIRTVMLAGATRKEEEGVVLVFCDESP